jgi:hypothetical protein
MAMSIERQLSDLITQIEVIFTDYNNNNTLSKKITSYKKCDILLKEARKLIEELKIEIINLDKITTLPTRDQSEKAKVLVDLLQIPSTNFDAVISIVKDLKAIHNGIPTSAEIIENVESEVVYDDLENI